MQRDVVAESEQILKLGLLFGEDIGATTDDFPEVLSFQHKLLQEYLAAIYITENAQLETSPSFLVDVFPTWEKIENHREVVQFACGLLAESDASLLINHVGRVLAQYTIDQLNTGVKLSVTGDESCILFSLLDRFEKEANILKQIHPYFHRYNKCGHSLDKVLKNTEFAYIEDIIGHTFELNQSQAQIILNFYNCSNCRNFDTAWYALNTMQANVVALHYRGDTSGSQVSKLSHFSGLKYLYIETYNSYHAAAVDALAKSIHSWGPEPLLTYCHLRLNEMGPNDIQPFLTGLCKCKHLMHLHLKMCNLYTKLSVLCEDPPPLLRYLALNHCSLDAADVDSITQAIMEDKLPNLQELDIGDNSVGEDAVGTLLETVILTRPHKQLLIKVLKTRYIIDCGVSNLPEQFVSEWQTKLTEFPDIKVHFGTILSFASQRSIPNSSDSDSDNDSSPISLPSSDEPPVQEMMAVRPTIDKWVEFDPQQ